MNKTMSLILGISVLSAIAGYFILPSHPLQRTTKPQPIPDYTRVFSAQQTDGDSSIEAVQSQRGSAR